MRMGLQQAPAEVISCLKQDLEENIIVKIENGSFLPGLQIGKKVYSCFESFKPKMRQKIKEFFDQMSPEVINCLKEIVDDEVLEKIKNGEFDNPFLVAKIRLCFEQFKSKEMSVAQKSKFESLTTHKEKLPEFNPEEIFFQLQNFKKNKQTESVISGKRSKSQNFRWYVVFSARDFNSISFLY